MKKITILLAVLLFLMVPVMADACWWPGCEQYQDQNIYGYQEQFQGIGAGYDGVGMMQGSSSNLASSQYESQNGWCHGASQDQSISGYQGQGQEQMIGFGYQFQVSEQSSQAWQSQDR